ncbi:CHRD domain-containing protein [Micromonospora sp. DT81.3]|uniref:CHRD domain-containing protein n=1 Tax=Actinomycetes TaxID=1760 RepID=UPI003CF6DDF6
MHRITRAAFAAAAVSALTLGGAVAAQAAPAIPLNNGQETTGADGGGHGFFSYDIDGDRFCYTLEVDGLTAPAVAAHIHVGDRRTAGPVVIPLSVGTGTSFDISACVTADPALLASIEEDPRDYYVNVHTPTYPGGEVRGQLK